MNLTYEQEEDILGFFNIRSIESARYLIKMCHLGRTDKMTPIEFDTAKVIIKNFSDINPLEVGNDNIEDLIDKCVEDAMIYLDILPKEQGKLSFKQKVINFFKPNKGFIAPFE